VIHQLHLRMPFSKGLGKNKGSLFINTTLWLKNHENKTFDWWGNKCLVGCIPKPLSNFLRDNALLLCLVFHHNITIIFAFPVNTFSTVILFLFVSMPFLSQNIGDCNGAIVVCDDLYEETDAPVGTGSVWEVAPGSCQTSGEFNSTWYTFTVQESGILNFILEPNNLDDDYDWSLFNITDNGCEGINSGNSPEVSCNSWGTIFPPNGTTGISTDLGGIGNSNGPGDILGPPFNEDLFVTEGETYSLVVMNWTGSIQGFSLDFGLAEASIFDDVAPTIISVIPNCAASELEIIFSEGIFIDSVQPDDFTISGTGGDFTVSTVANDAGATDEFTDSFTLTVNGAINPEGNYTLTVLDVMNYVEDACGNQFTGSFDFAVTDPMTFEFDVTDACNGEGGIVEIINVSGGTEPLTLTFDGDVQPDFTMEDLTPGFYNATLEDATGCTLTQNIEVENFVLSVDAGDDQTPCDMQTILEGASTGGSITWNAPVEVSFSDAGSPNSTASSQLPGTYALTETATLGECVVQDVVNITFSFPLEPEVVVTDASCHDFCDGNVQVIYQDGELTVSVGDEIIMGDDILFTGLCAQPYTLTAIDFAGCTFSEIISLDEPPSIVANFDADPQTASVTSPIITFTNQSLNDSASHWEFGNPVFFQSDEASLELEFPPVGMNYEVTLIVTDIYGCTDSITQTIIIEDDFMVFVPNAFSPNGDDINEVFLPQFSYDPTEYSLIIFNRWGEVIFETDDALKAWTGGVHGGEHFARDGVYNWVIEAKGNEPEKHAWQGHVVLFR